MDRDIDDRRPFSDEERRILACEDGDLYALAWGFDSAAELKAWGEQAERGGLPELRHSHSKTDTNQ